MAVVDGAGRLIAGGDIPNTELGFVQLVDIRGRGELCALRWDCVDFTTGVLQIRTSIAQQGGNTWEKDTKTHQQRRITIDPQTLAF